MRGWLLRGSEASFLTNKHKIRVTDRDNENVLKQKTKSSKTDVTSPDKKKKDNVTLLSLIRDKTNNIAILFQKS